MDSQNLMNGHLERKILLLVTRNSIIIVFTYLFLYLVGADPHVKWEQCVIAALLFGGVYWLIRTNFSNFIKRITVAWLMISVTMGFFFQGGFYGITSLDICCLILVLPVIFQGKERSFFISAFIMQIIALGFVQIFYPWLISKTLRNDLGIVFVIEAMVRCANMMYVGYMYKCEYEKEQARIVRINQQLESANVHIANYNSELEDIVNQRTKTIRQLNDKLFEYAFFNSHKVRGPLARILGLVYLIKLHYSRDEYRLISVDSEYIEKLHKSADELDTVIKEINAILEKGTRNTGQDLIKSA